MMDIKVQKRKGIGNVITTLIILIASVVLGAGVIFFGGSLFQTNSNQDSVQVTNDNLWYNSTSSTSESAFVVQNTGSKVSSISQITLRGILVPQSSWYYYVGALVNTTNTQGAINYAKQLEGNPATPAAITLAKGSATFTQASGPISLKAGQAAIIYLYKPGTVAATDTGLALTLNIQAGKATAVQSVSVQGIS